MGVRFDVVWSASIASLSSETPELDGVSCSLCHFRTCEGGTVNAWVAVQRIQHTSDGPNLLIGKQHRWSLTYSVARGLQVSPSTLQ